MKIADPERGFRKFREDIKRQREEREQRRTQPQQQPTQQPVQQQQPSTPPSPPSYQPMPMYTPVQPQQQSAPPNVTYNVQPPQQVTTKQKSLAGKVILIITATVCLVSAYYLITNPTGFMHALETGFQSFKSVLQTVF